MFCNSEMYCHLGFPSCGSNLDPLTLWRFCFPYILTHPSRPVCEGTSRSLIQDLDLMHEKWHLLETPHSLGLQETTVLPLPDWLHLHLLGLLSCVPLATKHWRVRALSSLFIVTFPSLKDQLCDYGFQTHDLPCGPSSELQTWESTGHIKPHMSKSKPLIFLSNPPPHHPKASTSW